MEPGTLEQKIAKLPEELKHKVESYVDALIISVEQKPAFAEPEAIYQKSKPNMMFNSPEVISEKSDSFTKESTLKSKKKREFGSLKGFITRMSDDFNAPMEEFKDYM